ncbi:hypothetical protein ACIP4Q_39375 [Streptomyces massasporeus]
MNRAVFLALALPLLVAECVAQFVLDDQTLTTVFALLCLGVIAVRWALGPRTAEGECPANCAKCAESESWGGEEL